MIIIKTPQPDTEERLVLVPLDACNEVREDDPRTKLGAKVGLTIFGCHARDATPADLARAGYGKLPMWVTSAADGQRLIGERDEARAAFLGCAQAVGVVYQTDGHADEPGPPAAVVAAIKELTKRVEEREADMHVRIRADYDRTVADSWRAEVAKVERGRDALVTILAKLFGWDDGSFPHAVMHVENAVLNLRADLSVEHARAEKAERELATERYEHDATLRSRDMIHAKLATVERERDEETRWKERWCRERDKERARADNAEAIIAETWEVIGGKQGLLLLPEVAATIGHERDTLRADLARLTAPAEGEPTDDELEAIMSRDNTSGLVDARDIYRLGVAHERARQQPEKDRATDEELGMVLYGSRSIVRWDELADGTRAEHVERARVVAARVRQERCLVAQAVGMGASLGIGLHSKGVDIHVSRPREDADGGEFFEGELVEAGRDDVPRADVPATLARLLGEVAK